MAKDIFIYLLVWLLIGTCNPMVWPCCSPHQDISVADGEIALYIAPIDISGFDKLDVKAIEKLNIKEECRGKMFNRYIDILPCPAT